MFTDKQYMAMVDRYKKAGGFVQLVQVIETCGPKKREQFMSIISQESPEWAEAINKKCITFEKIIGWKPEIILEILASVNMLSFTAALKSLSPEQLEDFLKKISHQDRNKIENVMKETNPNPNEIAASVMKVISETRNLLVQGSLKADKVDPDLVIPDDFEILLEKGEAASQPQAVNLSFDGPVSVAPTGNVEVDKLQKKVALLSKENQVLKNENQLMKDKLERIKKIA